MFVPGVDPHDLPCFLSEVCLMLLIIFKVLVNVLVCLSFVQPFAVKIGCFCSCFLHTCPNTNSYLFLMVLGDISV